MLPFSHVIGNILLKHDWYLFMIEYQLKSKKCFTSVRNSSSSLCPLLYDGNYKLSCVIFDWYFVLITVLGTIKCLLIF